MDTLKIRSKIMTGLVSKIVRSIVKKQLNGLDISLDIGDITIDTGQNGRLDFSLNGSITTSDIEKIVKSTLNL